MLLSSCMQPVDSDFGGQRAGLRDHELLWVLRLSPTPDSESNRAFFETALPGLLVDLLNGSVPAYDSYSMLPDRQPVPNVRELLTRFGGSVQNLSPLTSVVEVYTLVDLQAQGYVARPRYLQLIWADPAGQEPERNFVGVRLDSISTATQPYGDAAKPNGLLQYLRADDIGYSPVFLRTNQREYTIRSEAEADYVTRMVRSGRFEEIDWLENGINISGKSKFEIAPRTVLQYAGSYAFAADSAQRRRTLFLSSENDYLIADWSHRFRMEKIAAYDSNAFFSTSGETYRFLPADSGWTVQVILANDTLLGTRETVAVD